AMRCVVYSRVYQLALPSFATRRSSDLVGALDGDDDVVKVELFQQADVVEGAFHHGLGHRRAVLGQDVLFQAAAVDPDADGESALDRKSTRLNSSHVSISYAVFCSKKKI